MKWILIIMLHFNGGHREDSATLHSIEFSTYTACHEAGTDTVSKVLGYKDDQFFYVCVAKGKE